VDDSAGSAASQAFERRTEFTDGYRPDEKLLDAGPHCTEHQLRIGRLTCCDDTDPALAPVQAVDGRQLRFIDGFDRNDEQLDGFPLDRDQRLRHRGVVDDARIAMTL